MGLVVVPHQECGNESRSGKEKHCSSKGADFLHAVDIWWADIGPGLFPVTMFSRLPD